MAKSFEKFVYDKVKKVRNRLIWGYSVVFFVTCVVTFAVLEYQLMQDTIDNNSQLVESMNLQMKKSINSYLNKLENTSKIVFSKNDYISYDITRQKNDYENNIRMEKEIEEYLISVSLMDNYADFGIVYRNNHSLGKITDGLMDIYEGNIFYALSEYLGSDQTKWVTGYNNDYSRFIYLTKANDNAIFLASFYSTDLENVLIPEKQADNVRVLISDAGNNVIYSGNDSELGEKLPDELLDDISENNDCVVVSKNYITGISSCGSDWKINTVLSLEKQYENVKKTTATALVLTIFGTILFHLIGFLISSEKNPEISYKSSQNLSGETDELTGLLNPEATENKIADKIETCITGSTIMLALVSISNYNLILENYDEKIAEEAVLKVKNVLMDIYGENDIIGRIGKNEFAIFADFTEFDLFKAHGRLKENLNILEKNLAECELDNNRGMIKTAVGAVIYPDTSSDYDELYEQVIEALAQAMEKNNGKPVLLKSEQQEKGRV